MNKYLEKIDFTEATKLDFIKRITTPTGILQHTKFAIPDRVEGYATDDNARALLLTIKDFVLFGKHQALNFALIYLSYLSHAKTSDNWFFTYQTFDHHFKEETSQDAFGRVIWALGYTIKHDVRWDITAGAEHLFNLVKGNLGQIEYPRTKAYCLLGLLDYQQSKAKNDEIEQMAAQFTQDLVTLYEKNATGEWPWFEPFLTYANGLLPLALLKSYEYKRDDHVLKIAVESLEFLESQSKVEGKPSPVGSGGWYYQGRKRATWDQQPIDPAIMVMANVEAYRVLKGENYKARALEWFSWFHGNNLQELSVYDPQSGGSFDGLTKEGLNMNQGAESAIIYWLAYLELVELLRLEK